MTRAGAAAMDVFLQRFAPPRARLIALGLAAGTATLTVSGLPPQPAAPALASPPAGNTVLSAHTTLPGPATFQGLPTVPY
ncbi:MAG: hypothetical protein F4Z32_03535, partial [Gemmatimonadetes bacterium]|nr:hypothetical protein [Gemmatimonadota bacterium]